MLMHHQKKSTSIISLSTACMSGFLQSDHKGAMLIPVATLNNYGSREIVSAWVPGMWTITTFFNLDYLQSNTTLHMVITVQGLITCHMCSFAYLSLKSEYDNM